MRKMEMKEIIHIYGTSGSGTWILGQKICKELGYKFMDMLKELWQQTGKNRLLIFWALKNGS